MIDFTPKRWEDTKRNYAAWWDGTLDRPLISLTLEGRDPGRPEPKAPVLTQAMVHDLSIPAEAVIDRIDYELSKYYYLGDAFPLLDMDAFGPGITAAFIGAEIDNHTGLVWFRPKQIKPIQDLHFEYDPDNIWLMRILDINRAGTERWQGQVLICMPDLGGVLDILSTFRPDENLLLDLYDHPDEVKRLTWEIYELWHRFYTELAVSVKPSNPGYSDWSHIYSVVPFYTLQSDFAYMISPDMFDEFIKPELEASCRRLPHSMYHLDGIGQLPHLDSLLTIKELDAVQWVPGDGKPKQGEWPHVY